MKPQGEREPQLSVKGSAVKGAVLDIYNLIGQCRTLDMAGKLRVENAGAHHES
jgi:hypothetical protein